MDLKVICLVVCLFYFAPSSAKPTSNLAELKDGDLAEKFIGFLEQDKQFQNLMSKFEEDPDALTRQKRQTINEMEDDEDVFTEVKKPNDGFMDRAAKFVMELLQRFLKWINTE
nr:uncharacterized protein LOC111426799 [Onthophagus taurus]